MHRSAELRARAAGVRPDIQALRAIAVSLVLVYHLTPGRISGGFVGVDVFFVISGFLITAHLISKPPSSVGDLFGFWSRRIRRLLPASLLVLAVSLLVTRLAAPQALWLDTARQVRAAALYALNWNLAGQHVDYLTPADPPTAVQHFWSLSVEEQFYLGWPVLLAALFLAGRVLTRAGLHIRGIALVIVGTAAVVVTSLAWSVHITATDPSAAYFVTQSRIWELAAGGLLAAVQAGRARPLLQSPPVRIIAAWLGLAAIAVAAFGYTDATTFPGWHAVLPVLGAVAVIAGQAPRSAVSPAAVLALRPVQYVGDISYSIYLWHWPMIVLLPLILDAPRKVKDVVIIVGSILLAGLTKKLVEDRFRTPQWGRPLIKPFALAAVVMGIVVLGAQLQTRSVLTEQRADARVVQQHIADHAPCFGAGALDPTATNCTAETTSGKLTPTAVEAARERSDSWRGQNGKGNCFAEPDPYDVVTCTYGNPKATTSIALVGNSHAAEWVPTLRAIAAKHNWRITTYVAIKCAYVDVRQQFRSAPSTDGCAQWNKAVTADLAAQHYDLVVLTNLRFFDVAGVPSRPTMQTKAYEQGYLRTLRALRAQDLSVAVVADSPFPQAQSVPRCLVAHPDDYTPCDGTRSQWLRNPELTDAARTMADPRVTPIDLTAYICPTQVCPAAIGGVPVYFDNSHLSRTYALTLAPYLEPRLLAALQ